MELNIKWTEIREVNVLSGRFYFVAQASKEGNILRFCVAYQVMGVWRLATGCKGTSVCHVPFKVTHSCFISGVTHEVRSPTHSIGDRVRMLTSIDGYKEGSIGEIVGKYAKPLTWCVRMEDNFVILLATNQFVHYYPGGA